MVRHVKPGEQLCLACGLCCDGSLFGHVRVQPGDDAKKLKALGLPVTTSRSATPIVHFPQPCAALCADRTCRVYADRPRQCRTFECGVFQDATAGKIGLGPALRLVTKTRQRVNKIRRLLRELGDNDVQRSLHDRFTRTQRRIESGAVDPAAANTFAELSLAVHSLNVVAYEKFYTKPAAAKV